MPTYEFKCKHCGNKFDVYKSMSDTSEELCPLCHHHVERLISTGSGIIFKGNGFFITDYQKKHSVS